MEQSAVDTLLSLSTIRERAKIVYAAARNGTLSNFDFHPEALEKAAELVASIIERDFGPDRFNEIPPHGRWQHFEVGGIPRLSNLVDLWNSNGVEKIECTRRIVDLFFVSVLLDAGAGDSWVFAEPGTGMKYNRSEGLAVASLYMYKSGDFGTTEAGGFVSVDGSGLQSLTEEKLVAGMQASETNPLTGLASRLKILQALGGSLLESTAIFGPEGRPGNLVDFLLSKQNDGRTVHVKDLWSLLQNLLIPIWPKDRTHVLGTPIGDAWPLKCLGECPETRDISSTIRHIQPFHKLTQWLAYSLMVPFERVLGYSWLGAELLTGLPEYRNGGLFIDTRVLTLKSEVLERGRSVSPRDLPLFAVADDAIVEWRALTVALLDVLHGMVSKIIYEKSMPDPVNLSMAQVLEAGTWKAGRELAAKFRPLTRSSPILVESDGTVF